MRSVEIKLYLRANMRIGETRSGAKCRIDERFQNLLSFGILIVFRNKKF